MEVARYFECRGARVQQDRVVLLDQRGRDAADRLFFARVEKPLVVDRRVLLALGLGVGEADRSAAGPNQQVPFVECVEVFADRNFRYAEFPVEFFDRDRRLAFQSLQNH